MPSESLSASQRPAVFLDRDGVLIHTHVRNGKPYADPYMPSGPGAATQLYKAGDTRVLLGLRHQGGGKPFLAGEIAEARLYDRVLSAREIEVLRLIAGGNANKEIAVQLSITEETVKGHIKNILAKLDANDRTHAVTIGLKRGIIDL